MHFNWKCLTGGSNRPHQFNVETKTFKDKKTQLIDSMDKLVPLMLIVEKHFFYLLLKSNSQNATKTENPLAVNISSESA